MFHSRSLCPAIAGLLFVSVASAAPLPTYQPNYQPLTSASWVQDKNFYVLTLIEQRPAVRAELAGDPALAAILKAKATDAAPGDFQTAVAALTFSVQDIDAVRAELVARLPHSPALQTLVTDHLRPSGRYIQSAAKTDADLLGEAWVEVAQGINKIINQFALAKADADIDSPSYDPGTTGYQRMLRQAMLASVGNSAAKPSALFFEPSLDFALRLLVINRRDESARHEPLAQGENRAAMAATRHIDWAKFKYASLLVHGIGPETPGIAISDGSRENCATVAKLYHDGLAPLVIVSGGYVHPKQTIFCEALEMKKELMLVHGIPESAILIDPQARHTTTNVRNGVRLLLSVGAPLDKPSLSVAQKQHVDYIASAKFQQYCLEYYGIRCGPRTSDTTAEFLPSVNCMQTGTDPLDP